MGNHLRIRPFRSTDAAALVSFLHPLLRKDDILTAPGLLHYRQSLPRHARSRWWVGLSGREIIGWCLAELRMGTSKPGVGLIWVGVSRRHRRQGLGSRLYALGQTRLRGVGARELHSWAHSNSRAGQRFLRARGFHRSRAAKVWALDPTTVDLSEMPGREAVAASAGFRLAPLRQLLHRPRDLHRLFTAVVRDVPSDVTTDRIPFDEWTRWILASPTLDRDGSFVVLTGDEPVAMAWLDVDRETGRAGNHMTGTLPAYRHRGLARLAKLATIRWAIENRISVVCTSNDTKNTDMLALNEHLGYRSLPGYVRFVGRLRP